MHRIDGPNNVSGSFSNRNPVAGVPGTTMTADWLNAVQEEIAAVIEGSGLTLDKLDNGQLLAAIALLRTAAVGDEFGFTAGSDLTQGDGHLVGDTFGVVKASVLNGQAAVIRLGGVHTLPKTSANVIAQGERVYWDGSEVTNTAAGNRSIGVADEARGSGQTSIPVLLSGPPNVV